MIWLLNFMVFVLAARCWVWSQREDLLSERQRKRRRSRSQCLVRTVIATNFFVLKPYRPGLTVQRSMTVGIVFVAQ